MSGVSEINHNLLNYMKTRRSVPAKTMAGPGPTNDQIMQMAKIASRVPDHGKLAPWRFIQYGQNRKNELGKLILKKALENNPDLDEEQRTIELTRLSRSSTVIALISSPTVHSKIPEWEQVLSCGAVGLAWLIAANGFGFDSQWLTEWYAFDEDLSKAFGVKEGERIAGFIHIGTKTMPKTERSRPQLSDILTIME